METETEKIEPGSFHARWSTLWHGLLDDYQKEMVRFRNGGWVCSCGSIESSGICLECGTRRPELLNSDSHRTYEKRMCVCGRTVSRSPYVMSITENSYCSRKCANGAKRKPNKNNND